ncbi:MAG: 30S ribosomal protein S12 methylthiotransferase RimO [Coprobacillus sp.]|nr:30S ribosomal protein S12 methylthiotransferase RimO [Coprobacillus sp.]
MKNIALISLGCHKNLVDSENVLGYLSCVGYHVVNNLDDADIIIVNTCGFIEAAKRESIDTLFECLSYKGKKVVAIGCLVQRYLKDLEKEIPEIKDYIPINDYHKFNERFYEVDPNEVLKEEVDITKYRTLTNEVTSFLRLGEGCDNRCAFCAIPLIRGPFKSRSLSEIREEAQLLADKGVKEVVVLEQDTCSYGKDLKGESVNLVDVLKVLGDFPQFKMVRLLYLYPDEITDELIDYIATHPQVVPYFDIPIQHSEDHILKAMHRRGDKQFLINLFAKIKEKVPHAILRTTLMVGFYNETEEDVLHLIDFVKEINFDHVGVFKYSYEEGTPAYKFGDPISEEEKERRYDMVMRECAKMSKENNKKYVGETLMGLIVAIDGNKYLLRSKLNAIDDLDGQIIVTGNGSKHQLGDYISVKVTESTTYDLFATEI